MDAHYKVETVNVHESVSLSYTDIGEITPIQHSVLLHI